MFNPLLPIKTDTVYSEEDQFNFGFDYTQFKGQSTSAVSSLITQWNATSSHSWHVNTHPSPLFGSKLSTMVLNGTETLVIGDPSGNFVFLTSSKNYQIIKGTTYGEQFGAELMVADFNLDNIDDLIISAPTWSELTCIDCGRIYIYHQNLNGHLIHHHHINGERSYGRFGFRCVKIKKRHKL